MNWMTALLAVCAITAAFTAISAIQASFVEDAAEDEGLTEHCKDGGGKLVQEQSILDAQLYCEYPNGSRVPVEDMAGGDAA